MEIRKARDPDVIPSTHAAERPRSEPEVGSERSTTTGAAVAALSSVFLGITSMALLYLVPWFDSGGFDDSDRICGTFIFRDGVPRDRAICDGEFYGRVGTGAAVAGGVAIVLFVVLRVAGWHPPRVALATGAVSVALVLTSVLTRMTTSDRFERITTTDDNAMIYAGIVGLVVALLWLDPRLKRTKAFFGA
jgi:hypothetical protein